MDDGLVDAERLLVRFCHSPVLLPDRDAPDVLGEAVEAVGSRHHEVLVDLEQK